MEKKKETKILGIKRFHFIYQNIQCHYYTTVLRSSKCLDWTRSFQTLSLHILHITRQVMYCNVSLKRVQDPLLQWKRNKYYIWCVCRLSYTARNAHALYCHCVPSGSTTIFSQYLVKGAVFGKKNLLDIKFVVIFYNFCLKHITF